MLASRSLEIWTTDTTPKKAPELTVHMLKRKLGGVRASKGYGQGAKAKAKAWAIGPEVWGRRLEKVFQEI